MLVGKREGLCSAQGSEESPRGSEAGRERERGRWVGIKGCGMGENDDRAMGY